jgi:hypothetical protein
MYGHTIFVVENAHREAFWKAALASPEVADWIQNNYNRWLKVALDNDTPGRGMIRIPLTIRARFHVIFIDDIYKIDADSLLVKLCAEQKATLNMAYEKMKKTWSWDKIGVDGNEQLSFSLDCEGGNFLVARTKEEWVVLSQNSAGGFDRLGFEDLNLVEGDSPPIDLLDRAIFEADRHLKARKKLYGTA